MSADPKHRSRRQFMIGAGAAGILAGRGLAAPTPVKARTFPGLPDGIQPYDWALAQLRVPQAHQHSREVKKKLLVAVIDLGYRHHPLLDGHLWQNPKATRGDRHGWDFADDDATLEYSGPSGESPYLRNHHVFVAGEVAAVAPECLLMPLRVGYHNHESWWKAIRYGVDHGAKVLVMPHGYISRAPGSDVPLFYQGTDFGYPEDNPRLRQALEYAYDQGCLVFSGTADNRGRRVAYAPVSLDVVCAVGSTNRQDAASNLAADADYVEFGAPAGQSGEGSAAKESIWGLGGSEDYCSFQGGCMASGFAGGVAALVWSRFPDLTNEQLRQVLRNTARPGVAARPGPDGRDSKLGYGILDAYAAVSLKPERFCRDVRLLAGSAKVQEAGGTVALEVTLENQGVYDAQRAMVVVYNADPIRPMSPAGTFAKPGPELQTVQLGHAITPVRGLSRKAVRVTLAAKPPLNVWCEVYCLDRHDDGKVNRAVIATQ